MKSTFRFLQLSGVVAVAFLLMGAELKPGELAQNEATFYRGEGQRLQKIGDLQGAQIAYQKAVLLNPNYAQAHNDLGVILEKRGDAQGAEAAYLQAIQMNPALGAAQSNLGLLYERLGRLQEAGKHWAARVKLGPLDDPWVIAAREKLIAYKLDFSESPKEKQRQKVLDIRDAFKSAKLHMKAKQWSEAQADYNRILELDPGNEKATRGVEQAQKQWEKDSLRGPAASSDDADQRSLKSQEEGRWRQQQRRQEEERRKKEVQRRKDEEERAKKELQRLEGERRKEEKRAAEIELGWRAKKQKMQADRAYEAGKVYLHAKRWQDAEREFDQVLVLDPTHEGAMAGLKEVQAARRGSFSLVDVEEAGAPSASSVSSPSFSKEQAMELALRGAGAVGRNETVMPKATFVENSATLVQAPPVKPRRKWQSGAWKTTIPPATGQTEQEAQSLANQWTRQRSRNRQETVGELSQRAITAMRQARYEDAVTVFQQILILEPNEPDAQQGLKRAQTALAKANKS